jgi:hypothetical protein
MKRWTSMNWGQRGYLLLAVAGFAIAFAGTFLSEHALRLGVPLFGLAMWANGAAGLRTKAHPSPPAPSN